MPRRLSAAEKGPHPVDRHVGRKVAERRIMLGYNQSDLAKALGLTFQQIQKYEKGANRISASKLWAMADFLKVEISHFFEGLDGLSDPGGDSLPVDRDVRPATRATVEIGRLAPRLSSRQQKLALALISHMANPEADLQG
jgi:transcriptional regulator with XRE-family HTH domain